MIETELSPAEFQTACRSVGNEVTKSFRQIISGLGKESGAEFSIETPEITQVPTFATLSQFYANLFDVDDSGQFITVKRDGYNEILTRPAKLVEIPDVRQENDYSCGACDSMACANYFGVGSKDQKQWMEDLGTSEEASTDPLAIVTKLEELGLSVSLKENMTLDDLRAAWCEGKPVIVMVREYDSPGEKVKDKRGYGHFLTVLGLDFGFVFVQDSSADNVLSGEDSAEAPGRNMIREQDFLDRWHDRQYVRLGIVVGPKKIDASMSFDESKHPRGQPENKGEFAKKPTGESTLSKSPFKAKIGDRPASPDTNKRSPEWHAARKSALKHIATHLPASMSPEQRGHYASQCAIVLDQMGENALNRFVAGSKEIHFKSSVEDLNKTIAEIYPVLTKRITEGKILCAGLYDPAVLTGFSKLYLDGDLPPGVMSKKSEEAFHTYAHEFMHAIDGPNKEISQSEEWGQAWESEIVKNTFPVSKYATTSLSEGLAEFGRLLYTQAVGSPEEHHEQMVKWFPKCMAVLDKFGVL